MFSELIGMYVAFVIVFILKRMETEDFEKKILALQQTNYR